jgi:hypothetical protein
LWHVDIVVDLAWFSQRKGKLGDPKSRSRQPIPDRAFDNEFLLYGDDDAVRHLRVLVHTSSTDPPHDVVNANVHRWVNLLEVATGIAAPQMATSASLGPNTSGMLVMLGQGDESTDALHLDPKFTPSKVVDYAATANLMAAWQPAFHAHLFFLSRFLNHQLPPEVRWLNGYRLLEWHFRRGKDKLAKDPAYLDFLAQHGQAFDDLLGPGQDRKGVIEEVRAMVAHAMQSRAADPRTENGSTNLILRTFSALESVVIALINEGVVDGVTFMPTPR